MLGKNIWYDILFVVNSISKNLQSKYMCIDEAIEQLKGLLSFFEKYRENEFENALISSNEIAFEMNLMKQLDENVDNEIVKSLRESFRIDYFLYIVDKTITTLQSRFEQFKIYEDIFDFLFSVKKLKSLDYTFLKEKCLKLEKSLKHDNLLDINGFNLFSELNILREIIRVENDKPIDILNYIKRIDSFPNAYIVYTIMLTILVLVASDERSYSKLKIIKTYLRSTMSQERLNG